MKKILLLPLLSTLLLMTSCEREDPRYAMVRTSVHTLIEQLETDALFMRFIYYGQPPVQDLGHGVILRYSVTIDEVTTQQTFAYFSEDQYYFGSFANNLYGYRNLYTQLSATKINEEFGFSLSTLA